jgi:hypothetical protein
MILWMKVTRDKYELPLVVAQSLSEMSRITGRAPCTILNNAKRAVDRGGRSQYIRVEVDDDE